MGESRTLRVSASFIMVSRSSMIRRTFTPRSAAEAFRQRRRSRGRLTLPATERSGGGLPRPACVRLRERRSSMRHVVRTLLEGVPGPLAALDAEEVAAVDVDRAGERPQGIR